MGPDVHSKDTATNSKKSVMVTKMAWLLFPLVVLATLSKGTLASVKDASVCDPCDNKEQGQIRLRDPASNSSAGQVEVCFSGYWQTVCSAVTTQKSYPFTVTDSNVACYQLGFTKGSPAGTPGRGCKPEQETFLVVDPPCQGWEERLNNCIGLRVVSAGVCTLETAVSVACEGELPRRVGCIRHQMPFRLTFSTYLRHCSNCTG